MDILIGQKFRVKERSELLLDPNTCVSSQINPGTIFLVTSGTGLFDSYHEEYCGEILTVGGVHRDARDWDDDCSKFIAEESGFMLWYPWMVELIEDVCRVDENLFLSCLLL